MTSTEKIVLSNLLIEVKDKSLQNILRKIIFSDENIIDVVTFERPELAQFIQINTRLEELRTIIKSGNISYGELFELQSLADHIPSDDVELLEWAGVPENN